MMVTGELPFHSRSNLAMLKKKMEDAIVPASQLVPELNPRVDAAIRRAMRAHPDQRFGSCLEFIAALNDDRMGAGSSQSVAGKKEKSRKDSGNPSGAERRAAVRYVSDLDTSCTPPSRVSEGNWSAKVKDISTTGINLVLGRRFEPGTTLVLELQNANEGVSCTMLVQVRRIHESSPKKWSTGCAFLRRLTDLELKGLL
jgi:hypothetical protein